MEAPLEGAGSLEENNLEMDLNIGVTGHYGSAFLEVFCSACRTQPASDCRKEADTKVTSGTLYEISHRGRTRRKFPCANGHSFPTFSRPWDSTSGLAESAGSEASEGAPLNHRGLRLL